ncbi:chromate resistance protein ChrB domain-containing protein [Roseovarius sp. 217]|uniref:chromate resistance protein ChrB domain-containing protein n=1 Tax=Roseovarius sp. (strain 217) TaxID=314264 RepID=UPI000068553C|nr:chromate resistance protein ChrB domain-containing protein [Roseovarius sp. 217]EAQ24701.1 superoxide dismutase SodM-like protein [Roseovarius sp. 217]
MAAPNAIRSTSLPASSGPRAHRSCSTCGSRKISPPITVCQAGHRRSRGTAAWLRAEGYPSEYLDGGFEVWCAAGLPLIDPAKLPARDAQGRTIWVTRSRPKIYRIACPWLIRRLLDPRAIILFVAPTEVIGASERQNASPFDIDDVFWSLREDLCTFDVMLAEFGLNIPASCV